MRLGIIWVAVPGKRLPGPQRADANCALLPNCPDIRWRRTKIFNPFICQVDPRHAKVSLHVNSCILSTPIAHPYICLLFSCLLRCMHNKQPRSFVLKERLCCQIMSAFHFDTDFFANAVATNAVPNTMMQPKSFLKLHAALNPVFVWGCNSDSPCVFRACRNGRLIQNKEVGDPEGPRERKGMTQLTNAQTPLASGSVVPS